MRVAVIGAGIIGLACARELIRGSHDVTVFDAHPGQGATYAAAGMLSPGGEAWFGEEPLLRLGLASARLWPDFAADLATETGFDVDFRAVGTLLVGKDRDDLDGVLRTTDLLAEHGVSALGLNRAELLSREPTLSARIAGGVLLPDDHNVNPRKVATALLAGVGERLLTVNARPDVVGGTCRGVVTDRGAVMGADAVIVATGHHLEEIPGMRRAVRPVRGEVIRAHTDDPSSRTIRATIHGRPLYVVPREGGEVVIGATSEEHAGDPMPTVGGALRLLSDARTLVPTLETARILDLTCRIRPGTTDNAPLIGPSSTEGLFIAGGHFRGGVLLAPITALAMRAHLEGAPIPESARTFFPQRFDTQDVRSSV